MVRGSGGRPAPSLRATSSPARLILSPCSGLPGRGHPALLARAVQALQENPQAPSPRLALLPHTHHGLQARPPQEILVLFKL